MNNVIALSNLAYNIDQYAQNGEYIARNEPTYQGAWKEKIFNVNEGMLGTIDSNGNPFQVPNKKALIVDDQVINIVSDRYKVVQPSDVMRSFERTSGLTIDNVLSNPKTGGLLIKTRLASPKFLGEDHQIDLTFYTGHNGKYRTILTLQALRMACFNQLPAINSNKSLWLMNEKHYKDFDLLGMESLLDSIPLQLANFKSQYESLADISITKKQFLELFAEEKKATDKTIEEISSIYSFARGQRELSDNTAYKAYNAITYYNTHSKRASKTEQIERETFKNANDNHKFLNSMLALFK